MQVKTFDERWFGIEENNKKYRFLLFAPNNKTQLMGFSEWVESKEACLNDVFRFVVSIREHSYKIEIRPSTNKPRKYFCTFLNNDGDILFSARGYISPKKACEREKRICDAVKKSMDFQKETRF